MPRKRLPAPIRPSAAIEAAYRARLDDLIECMHRSLKRWIVAEYRRSQPEITNLAQDRSPAEVLRARITRLTKRWQRLFDAAAPKMASYFAKTTQKRTDAAMRSILRKGGISVRFQMGKAATDVLDATVNENVALIRSISQQHLTQVASLVMRGVQSGRDLHTIAAGLQDQLGVSKRKAALISRDQSNKATGNIQRVRAMELGVKQAIWVHSAGGKVPRRSHVKAGRERTKFDLSTGWFDPDVQKNIIPGELINCRCVFRMDIPGFS